MPNQIALHRPELDAPVTHHQWDMVPAEGQLMTLFNPEAEEGLKERTYIVSYIETQVNLVNLPDQPVHHVYLREQDGWKDDFTELREIEVDFGEWSPVGPHLDAIAVGVEDYHYDRKY